MTVRHTSKIKARGIILNMKLTKLTSQLNNASKSNDWNQHVYAFHGLNIITLFVKEPYSNLYFVIRCMNVLLPKFRLVIKEYPGKSPAEFMDELFYFNKTNYLVTGVKTKAITKLFHQNHITCHFPKDKSKQESFEGSIRIKKNEKPLIAIENNINKYQKIYTNLVKYSDKFFNLKKISNNDKSTIKKVKNEIKRKDFERLSKKQFDVKTNHNHHKSSADIVPKLVHLLSHIGETEKKNNKNNKH